MVYSVFQLHNTRANRELSVLLDGKHIRHDSHPVYLGITLDRTLTYKKHLQLEMWANAQRDGRPAEYR